MPKEKNNLQKGERTNPNSFHMYVRKGEDEEALNLFDELILKDPFLLRLKQDGELKYAIKGIRSVMIMRLIKLYNKSHIQVKEKEEEEQEEEEK